MRAVVFERVGQPLTLAAEIPIRPEVQTMPLAEANAGLAALRNGTVSGAAVLTT